MKKPRLLLVDDDPLIAESLAFALQADFDVTRAQDRLRAVEQLREGLKPELALIDLGLPRLLMAHRGERQARRGGGRRRLRRGRRRLVHALGEGRQRHQQSENGEPGYQAILLYPDRKHL